MNLNLDPVTKAAIHRLATEMGTSQEEVVSRAVAILAAARAVVVEKNLDDLNLRG